VDAERIKSEIVAALVKVAPEVQGQNLDPDRNFRDQYEFDSIDFVDFIQQLEVRLNVTIPQSDYPKLSSLDGALRYLMSAAAELGDSPGASRHN
jgi:acyl carrier protein